MYSNNDQSSYVQKFKTTGWIQCTITPVWIILQTLNQSHTSLITLQWIIAEAYSLTCMHSKTHLTKKLILATVASCFERKRSILKVNLILNSRVNHTKTYHIKWKHQQSAVIWVGSLATSDRKSQQQQTRANEHKQDQLTKLAAKSSFNNFHSPWLIRRTILTDVEIKVLRPHPAWNYAWQRWPTQLGIV